MDRATSGLLITMSRYLRHQDWCHEEPDCKFDNDCPCGCPCGLNNLREELRVIMRDFIAAEAEVII
jgi:hypothetical protein